MIHLAILLHYFSSTEVIVHPLYYENILHFLKAQNVSYQRNYVGISLSSI